ncbi:MAG: hypothetical protein ACLPV8_26010 [Steroidobacteraceae bacterium]
MNRHKPAPSAVFLLAVLSAANFAGRAADRFDAAVAQPGRPAADLTRDAKET